MKRKLTFNGLLMAAMLVVGTMNAWAGEHEATLTHTASSFCSADANAYTSTIDAEKEHVNNNAFNAAWQGAAYAEFAVDLPVGESITSATLKFTSIGESRRERPCDVLYVNVGEALDYTELAGGSAKVNLAGTVVKNINFAKGAEREHEIDVKDAIKAIVDAGQSYIIFKFTGNPGGGDIYGKGSGAAPTLVIETADASTQTKYTVKFVDVNEVELKDAVEYDGTIGELASVSEGDKANIWTEEGTKKYIYDSASAEEITLNADAASNVITLTFREAETYSYSVLSNLGGVIASGSYFEGETVYVGYPRYALVGTDLYEAAATSKEYRAKFDLTEDEMSNTVTYNMNNDKSVVFYKEAEDIEGITVSETGNIPVRASNAKGATTTEDIEITTLPAGKYIFHVGIFTSKSSFDGLSAQFGIGEETFTAEFGSVNLNEVASDEYELSGETTISYLASSSDGTQFDYIWIEQTDAPANITIGADGYATFSSSKALDFTYSTKITAYIATSSEEGRVIMTPINKVPANTGLLLFGESDEIPQLEGEADEITTNLLMPSTGANVAASNETKMHYVLAKQNGVIAFYNLAEKTAVPFGKAYLELDTPAEARLEIVFGETTGIQNVKNTASENNVIFNLAGQRVVKAQKGLYILNGKKIIKN